MRRVRSLFLIAIAGIAAYLGVTYRERLEELRRRAPPAPKALPLDVDATASDWHWERSAGDGPKVTVRAGGFRQIKEPNRFELDKVELKIYHKDGKSYDHVLSDRAVFDLTEAYLYSEGEADITMGVPEGEQPPPGKLIRIRASGIRFDSRTGKAETDRAAFFDFERGQGRAVGASYDPSTRDLHLRSQAEIVWKDSGPNPRPMKVESEQVLYKETESKIYLSPWSRFRRGNTRLNGAAATVFLDKNGIRQVDAASALGSDQFTGRSIEYAAETLKLFFSEKSEIERIEGRGGARLVATSEYALTTTTTEQVDMEFEDAGGDSLLRRVHARGKTMIESKPIVRQDRLTPETRTLRSDVVTLKMTPDGRELETMETATPGVLEFIPNRPGQKRRRVDGDRFLVNYGPQNRLDTFRASAVVTRTENEPVKGKPVPPALTWSKELSARFAEKTGDLERLDQWGDFRYEEGERRARSGRAALDNNSGRIILRENARVWDPQGSTSADRIEMQQNTSDFFAEGNVTSSRLPDAKAASTSMLSSEEPLQARAHRMTTTGGQSLIVYEGAAVLWQGSSRLQADRIEIDRGNHALRAEGKVVSQLLDQRKPTAGKAAAPLFTLIHAPEMTYTDSDRMAHYRGGSTLRRGEMEVKAREIRAFLKEESGKRTEGESSLDRALADGGVVILQSSKGRTRRGSSEHAEYYLDEGKVVLEGGQPVLEDSLRGATRGRQLIYYSTDDRLLVNGVPAQPAVSRIRRK